MSYRDRIQIIPNIICHIHFIFYDFWKHKEAITFGFWHWSPPRASIQSRNGDFNAIRSRFSMCLGMSLFCCSIFWAFFALLQKKENMRKEVYRKTRHQANKKGNLKSSFFFFLSCSRRLLRRTMKHLSRKVYCGNKETNYFPVGRNDISS